MATPKRKPGRPRRFGSVKEMAVKIDEYFAKCDARKKTIVVRGRGEDIVTEVPDPERYTIPGLAYHLGFCARSQLADYAADYPEFSDTVSRARLRIEMQRLGDCADPSTKNSNGIKFDLANNFGYRERQEIDHTTKGGPIGGAVDLAHLSEAEIEAVRKAVYGPEG